MTEKSRALTLLEQGKSFIDVAADLGTSRNTIYRLKRAAELLPPGTIPKRKEGTGAARKTSPRTDNILRREVMSDPSVTSASIKKKHPDLLQNVALRTIRHRLQKDLGLPARRAAKKPLLTKAMKMKRLNFCKTYKHWTAAHWKKVMFSDESTFRLVRGESKIVRRPSNVSRYDPKYTVKTVKHPDSVMVWGAFSGNKGRGGLYFLPKNVTMRGTNYLEVLKQHMLPFWEIHRCEFFMHDGAPAHRSQLVKRFFNDNNISVLEWPGNFLDLNPIENAWNLMKSKVQETASGSIKDLIESLKKIWVTIDPTYFANLTESMPNRLRMIIKCKGNMTKY